MNYSIEAIFVGIYTTILYLLFSYLPIKNIYVFFFILGFFKHFFGNFLEIHTYYCNHGDACKNKEKKISNPTSTLLFIESCLEGCLFLCLGFVLYCIPFLRKHLFVLFFIIGFLLHILFELLGIHKNFCIERCNSLDSIYKK